jgi:hypothetical protein
VWTGKTGIYTLQSFVAANLEPLSARVIYQQWLELFAVYLGNGEWFVKNSVE